MANTVEPNKIPNEAVDPNDGERQTAPPLPAALVPDTPSSPEVTDAEPEPARETPTEAATQSPVATSPVADDLAKVEQPPEAIVVGPDVGVFRRFWRSLRTHPKTAVALTLVILLVGAALVAPVSRYRLLGLVLRNNFTVSVLDDGTQKPVTNATVTIDGTSAKTNNQGRATLRVHVGNHQLTVEKKYYRANSQNALVPLLHQKNDWRVYVHATGRQVPIKVTNKINGTPIENALVRVADTEVRTNGKGEAIVVLPADKATLAATISAANYNDLDAAITVTEQITDKNTFAVTPAGKLYFLSNLSGKLDIVKTNIDGTDRQTVLAGTGNEDSNDTVLLAARDWRYLALKAKRDNNPAKLYLLDASSDKLTTIDNSNASFNLIGWYGSRFIYTSARNDIQNWQPGGQALKSYDATANRLTVIDQTAGEGTGTSDYGFTNFSTVQILNNELVYAQNWYASTTSPNHLDGKNVTLYSARPDGSSKQTIKDFAIPAGTQYSYYVGLLAYQPQAVYVQVPMGSSSAFYSYTAGKLTAANISSDKFFNPNYVTYLLSPSGQSTFWAEVRDGKNTLFVGDANGQNGKQIASLSDYTPYGWYSDNYLLVSKDGSELYVLPVSGGPALKVTDYHKPAYNFRGYGYGYGGL